MVFNLGHVLKVFNPHWLNPLYLGLLSGLGEALGGITVYLTGAGGGAIWSRLQTKRQGSHTQPSKITAQPEHISGWRKSYYRLIAWVERRGASWFVFVTSAFIWGLYYPAGLAAGTLRIGQLKRAGKPPHRLMHLVPRRLEGRVEERVGRGLDLVLGRGVPADRLQQRVGGLGEHRQKRLSIPLTVTVLGEGDQAGPAGADRIQSSSVGFRSRWSCASQLAAIEGANSPKCPMSSIFHSHPCRAGKPLPPYAD